MLFGLLRFLLLDFRLGYRRGNVHGSGCERLSVILDDQQYSRAIERHTLIKKPLSLASPTMVLHLSSPLSNVWAFPMTNKELFARVRATFIRLASLKKPIVGADPDLTVERMMMSFS